MSHLAIIDGSNYVFRAFHAIRHLSNSRGLPTNAVYGYLQMVRRVLAELKPTHVAVAFDPKGGSFRQKEYPAYKAQRPPMPEDLAVQWPYVWELTQAFHFNLLCVDGYEADDVIATLARQAEGRGWDVTIISSDKDLMQLINTRIHMLDTMKSLRFDAAAVYNKWGVEPEQIVDLLALAGDSADNIPGVPGIGPKTAALLLGKYGDMENLLSHANDIPQKKRRENLIQYADDARLAYNLVRLREDVPLAVRLDDLMMKDPDNNRLKILFHDLEFHRLLAEFDSVPGSSNPKPVADHKRIDHLVHNDAMLQTLFTELEKANLIAIDTETTSLNCHEAELVGLSFSVRSGEGWYIPLGHQSDDKEVHQLDKKKVLAALRPILADPDKYKCGHNLKYDLQVLRRSGLELAGIRYDSMLLAYCLHPGKYPPKLNTVAQEHLDYSCIPYEAVAGKGAKQISFDLVPIATALPYATEDAEVALRLCRNLGKKLAERIDRHDGIELPLSLVLADMEWTGAHLDRGQLAALSDDFGHRIKILEKKIHAAAGDEINIQSPKQIGVLLFETLGIPDGKKTKSGQWSTGQEVLEKLSQEYEVPRLILDVRQLVKLKSTYTDTLQKLIDSQTGRVHTSYNQAVTTTGRLSSSYPNLQNIPIKSSEGREIRKAFTAEAGNILIAADYSQIELRLMAHFSADPVLNAAFANGEDIHAATAAAVNRVELNDVTRDMRRRAKIINFGILYGMSAFGLAKQLGVSRGEAQEFINAYFAGYPKVRDFMEATLDQARRNLFVETLLGHRVYVPEITSSNGMRRQFAERTAINAPLQGSAADIIKVAMIRLHARLKKETPEARLILQVHDELVLECPEPQLDKVSALMRKDMESAVKLSVPLTVDIGTGESWFEAHRL
ncbi:MAG: DNA polymerase I [Mariprofundaceae bacterium]